MNNLNIKTAGYYQSAFRNGLILTGVEEGEPQWMGDDVHAPITPSCLMLLVMV